MVRIPSSCQIFDQFFNHRVKSRDKEEVTQRRPLCNLFFISGFYSVVIENAYKSCHYDFIRDCILNITLITKNGSNRISDRMISFESKSQ